MKYILWLGVLTLSASCFVPKEIIDKPILFDAERRQLSLDYLSDRYGLQQEEPTIDPKMIVLHWTVIPTLEESFETFYPSALPDRPDISGASALNVSSQFMVDRDGTIYRLLPETTMARHVIGLNHCAIGIENVGGTGDLPLTEAQMQANIWLVRYLKRKFPIEYLIGHYEYTLFEGHKLWLEKDAGYRTIKDDPGKAFMKKVRKAVRDEDFKPLPEKS
ncbi:N-acetylmuramoyl-L-alanine amidase [Aggregatimonas sangjinii]|uniref:N-acetylmuramoyl-L-alanine amidase n=1 Tax=Aggregatimonas sangjinii TaxID=2583587 RepID=A0A5B7SNG2_9FLAO|nr:peptidoglycan recognition family protein [Aggregatimonas sangjinii]QCX00057.1 N-acetylmuramoyl-L-alanine amidase [Aggregatimonas sangjinii]